jgi:hypothetical protein
MRNQFNCDQAAKIKSSEVSKLEGMRKREREREQVEESERARESKQSSKRSNRKWSQQRSGSSKVKLVTKRTTGTRVLVLIDSWVVVTKGNEFKIGRDKLTKEEREERRKGVETRSKTINELKRERMAGGRGVVRR